MNQDRYSGGILKFSIACKKLGIKSFYFIFKCGLLRRRNGLVVLIFTFYSERFNDGLVLNNDGGCCITSANALYGWTVARSIKFACLFLLLRIFSTCI